MAASPLPLQRERTGTGTGTGTALYRYMLPFLPSALHRAPLISRPLLLSHRLSVKPKACKPVLGGWGGGEDFGGSSEGSAMWYGEHAINGDDPDHWSYGRELKHLVCPIMLAVRAVVWY